MRWDLDFKNIKDSQYYEYFDYVELQCQQMQILNLVAKKEYYYKEIQKNIILLMEIIYLSNQVFIIFRMVLNILDIFIGVKKLKQYERSRYVDDLFNLYKEMVNINDKNLNNKSDKYYSTQK